MYMQVTRFLPFYLKSTADFLAKQSTCCLVYLKVVITPLLDTVLKATPRHC